MLKKVRVIMFSPLSNKQNLGKIGVNEMGERECFFQLLKNKRRVISPFNEFNQVATETLSHKFLAFELFILLNHSTA